MAVYQGATTLRIRRTFTFLVYSAIALLQAGAVVPAKQVSFGGSIVKLNGPWKFHVGTSARWADPDFDDSKWETVDLTPTNGAFDPTLGIGDYVPGWTARGHPNYSGDAWYRMRVEIVRPLDEPIALAGPQNVDDAYEVFANGTLLGSFGKFSPGKTPQYFVTRPKMFPIPQKVTSESLPSTIVIAFHVYMDAGTLQSQPDVGGFHIAPRLGSFSTIRDQYHVAWVNQIQSFVMYPILAFLMIMLAVASATITLFDRQDPVYWWLASVFFVTALAEAHLSVLVWTELEVAHGFVFTLMNPIIFGLWLMIWWTWFRLRRPIWIPRTIGMLTLTYLLCFLLGQGLFHLQSHALVSALQAASLSLRFLMLSLFTYIVARGIRKHGLEGWVTIPAALLVGITQFQEELSVLHVRVIYFPFGVQVSLGDIANLTLLAVMFVLLLRRLGLSMAQQRELALDVQQAQEVQQVLLIEPLSLPRLSIGIEYRPARQVGGDFFQIIPNMSDGSVLIVAGDVAGKGLTAGMLVALLVGAIRSTAEIDPDPAFVLEALNRRLLGRGGALATCLALRIDASGSTKLVNAGHLPPYLNAKELAMEGALPLGAAEETDFSVTHFQLVKGDSLMLLSDGIAEAQDRTGGLFGFERIHAFLEANGTASELAAAAEAFGQQDDISIVSVGCLA